MLLSPGLNQTSSPRLSPTSSPTMMPFLTPSSTALSRMLLSPMNNPAFSPKSNPAPRPTTSPMSNPALSRSTRRDQMLLLTCPLLSCSCWMVLPAFSSHPVYPPNARFRARDVKEGGVPGSSNECIPRKTSMPMKMAGNRSPHRS